MDKKELKDAIEKAYDALAPNDEEITLENLYIEVLKILPTLTREEIYKAVVIPERIEGGTISNE